MGSRSGLDKCYRSHAFSEGVSNSSPASVEDFIFCWLLLGPLPEFPVADGLRPLDLKDSSRAGIDECLDLLQCRSRGYPCFSSLQQDRFYCGVKDSDFDVDGHVEAQMLFIWRKAALTLPVLTVTLAPVSPCLSTTLPR